MAKPEKRKKVPPTNLTSKKKEKTKINKTKVEKTKEIKSRHKRESNQDEAEPQVKVDQTKKKSAKKIQKKSKKNTTPKTKKLAKKEKDARKESPKKKCEFMYLCLLCMTKNGGNTNTTVIVTNATTNSITSGTTNNNSNKTSTEHCDQSRAQTLKVTIVVQESIDRTKIDQHFLDALCKWCLFPISKEYNHTADTCALNPEIRTKRPKE
ncbi:hypothetical protein RFI_16949 [Reticulomyxa filosa]|uniref:Uncharacterized protein n=1 Tax=Reticulomyxa filosa TaxID=46433 RepID=X6N2Z9_RETFI|nr:hypothetical protein RFI_16949 [Reticulomyxa filosa]|eukprot:ETO20268.1 hypothetical protein RFI_16949 [Reticulomyxa filosa]